MMWPTTFKTKKRWTRAGRSEELINTITGEIHGIAAIHQIEEKDDEEFVKVFAAGLSATYELTGTAKRVFETILQHYQAEPMGKKRYAESVSLFWHQDKINGKEADMSVYTFNRGLRELLDKGFLAPKAPSVFWVNHAMFFKGNRVLFIKEYRRKTSVNQQQKPQIERQEPDEVNPVENLNQEQRAYVAQQLRAKLSEEQPAH